MIPLIFNGIIAILHFYESVNHERGGAPHPMPAYFRTSSGLFLT